MDNQKAARITSSIRAVEPNRLPQNLPNVESSKDSKNTNPDIDTSSNQDIPNPTQEDETADSNDALESIESTQEGIDSPTQ